VLQCVVVLNIKGCSKVQLWIQFLQVNPARSPQSLSFLKFSLLLNFLFMYVFLCPCCVPCVSLVSFVCLFCVYCASFVSFVSLLCLLCVLVVSFVCLLCVFCVSCVSLVSFVVLGESIVCLRTRI